MNGVAPGPVDTPLSQGLPFPASALPPERMGRSDEIAYVKQAGTLIGRCAPMGLPNYWLVP